MHILARGAVAQRLRLVSGLILFVFALTHFLNTAIGIVSLTKMDEFDQWRTAVIHSLPVTVVLTAALVIHICLGLYRLASRKTWRMPWWEAAQILLGLAIPVFLFPHIVNTRLAQSLFNVNVNYLYELTRLWPDSAIVQSALLLIVWIHGCIGIHFWLRLSPSYRAMQPAMLVLAIAIPLLGLIGFAISGRAVSSLIEQDAAFGRIKQLTRWPTEEQEALLASYRAWIRPGFLAALGIVAAVILARYQAWRSAPRIAVAYAGGPTVNVQAGPTLLEISRMNRVPHASVCGGRARCSTCRVRIDAGGESLPPAVLPESAALAAVGAPANVRLACQLRPTQSLTVTRLLRPIGTGPEAATTPEADSVGTETALAVLYINLRSFNELTRTKLPYDAVFLLNQFFKLAAGAVKKQGGFVDNTMGDAVLAVFGYRQSVEKGTQQALRALQAIDHALDDLNTTIGTDLTSPLRFAAGLHSGRLILGRIGYDSNVDLTVVGPAVNIAIEFSRLARERDQQLVLSSDTAKLAGLPPSDSHAVRVYVGGGEQTFEAAEVPRVRDLSGPAIGAIQGSRVQPPSA